MLAQDPTTGEMNVEYLDWEPLSDVCRVIKSASSFYHFKLERNGGEVLASVKSRLGSLQQAHSMLLQGKTANNLAEFEGASLQTMDAPGIALQRQCYLYSKIRPHIQSTETCNIDGKDTLARYLTTPLPEDAPLRMLIRNSAD